jgi:NTE family protein
VTLIDSASTRSDFLRAVPILAGISQALRSQIADHARWVNLTAGEWLFRQGEAGDSLYVVRTGRLEVVLEHPETAAVRQLGRCAVVGELALLTASPRSASVRAVRDTELLCLGREDFAALLRSEPEFAVALTRELGRELQASRPIAAPERPRPATITLLEVGDSSAFGPFTRTLTRDLGELAKIAVLDGTNRSLEEHGELLDRLERDHDHVVLLAGSGAEEDWTRFCLRQSDRVIAVSEHGNLPAAERFASLATAEVLDRAAASDGHRIAVLARRLAGRSIGVVLSGGGARGLAHIGVFAELLAAGITIDRIGGCSMGAFVGALFADGRDAREIRDLSRAELVLQNPLNDYTVPLVSVLRGGRARAMVERTFGDREIEQLEHLYYATSCDLVTGHEVVHREGRLAEAVAASMCLPGVFPPVARFGGLLVDGGVINNLPVQPMASTNEGPVIAVDVSAGFVAPEARLPRSGRPRARRLAARTRQALVGSRELLPNFKEVLTRAIGIGSIDSVAIARGQADVLITPSVADVDTLDFSQLDRVIEMGRRAARAALAENRIPADRL